MMNFRILLLHPEFLIGKLSQSKMQIKIKTSNENAFSLEVTLEMTVLELKNKIANHFNEQNPESQRYS
jgi:hypothetical protein